MGDLKKYSNGTSKSPFPKKFSAQNKKGAVPAGYGKKPGGKGQK